jgi:hypothetical protein
MNDCVIEAEEQTQKLKRKRVIPCWLQKKDASGRNNTGDRNNTFLLLSCM